MKKGFSCVFPISVLALAANAAWADCPSPLLEDSETYECYINLSEVANTIDFPTGMTSFKVYDDGGKDGAYTIAVGKQEYINVYAPDGYRLRIKGNVDVGPTSFGICDSKGWNYLHDDNKEGLVDDDINVDAEHFANISLRPYETNGSHAGFALTVSLVKALQTDAVTGEKYVNLPANGVEELTITSDDIASGLKTFKVYDDGGKDGVYSADANSNLWVHVPTGYKFVVTGNVTHSKSKFYILDGALGSTTYYKKCNGDGCVDNVEALSILGSWMNISLESSNSDVGLDLTVSIVETPLYCEMTDDGITAFINGDYNGTEAIGFSTFVAVDKVVFNRTFSTSGYSTIVLPFSFNAKNFENVESVIEFDGMTTNDKDELAVGMKYVWCSAEVEEYLESKADPSTPEKYEHCNSKSDVFTGDMTAYTPYMVQMGGSELVFKEGATLEVTPAKLSGASDGSGWTFMPVLQKKVFTKEETKDGRIWGFAGEERNGVTIGKFVRFGKGAYVQPFRAYLVSDKPQLVSASPNAQYVARPAVGETASLPENIDVVIVSRGNDGEKHTTTIGTFNTRTGEFKMLRDYDLKGRKTNITNRAQGAYYGKKVLKK